MTTGAPVPRGKTYFPALDGLRTICCVWVIFGHGFFSHPYAWFFKGLSHSGVHVFFALSGFLITTLMLGEIQTTGKFNKTSFYYRRCLRIFPVYFAALFLAATLLGTLGDKYARPFGSSMQAMDPFHLFAFYAGFIGNFYHGTAPTTLEILWSISVEEQFYLAFGILMAGVKDGSRILLIMPFALLISLAARLHLAMTYKDAPELIYHNSFANGDHLVCGVLLAYVWHRKPNLRQLASKLRYASLLQVCSLAAILGLSAWSPHTLVGLALFTPISAFFCAMLVGALASGQGPLAQLLGLSWMRRLGRLTYAGYVFHLYPLVVCWWIAKQISSDPIVMAPLRTILAIPGTFAVAYLVQRIIEQPIARWLKPNRPHSKALSAE